MKTHQNQSPGKCGIDSNLDKWAEERCVFRINKNIDIRSGDLRIIKPESFTKKPDGTADIVLNGFNFNVVMTNAKYASYIKGNNILV